MQEHLIVKPIKVQTAKAAIEERDADFKVNTIAYLGGGSSSAFVVNNSLLVKFPKLIPADSAYLDFMRNFDKESKLYNLFSKRLSPHRIIHPLASLPGPTKHFRGPIFTYELFHGREIAKQKLGTQGQIRLGKLLGDFLTKLHTTPLQVAKKLGLPIMGCHEINKGWHSQYRKITTRVFPLLNTTERNWVKHIYLDFFKSAGQHAFKPTLIHGDLGAENILAPSKMRHLQVIDWEDMAVGDPVADFCIWYQTFGAEFLDTMLENYRRKVDSGFIQRVKFYADRLPMTYFLLYKYTGNKHFLTYAKKYLHKLMERHR